MNNKKWITQIIHLIFTQPRTHPWQLRTSALYYLRYEPLVPYVPGWEWILCFPVNHNLYYIITEAIFCQHFFAKNKLNKFAKNKLNKMIELLFFEYTHYEHNHYFQNMHPVKSLWYFLNFGTSWFLWRFGNSRYFLSAPASSWAPGGFVSFRTQFPVLFPTKIQERTPKMGTGEDITSCDPGSPPNPGLF